MGGLNGDHFTPRQYQDIASWGSNMILSTSATVTGKLFIFNGTTKTLTDSISPGFKNTGKLFIQGDRLYGIAQDTTNATQTIDSTRFYIINLSTKTVVYNQKYVGTVNTCQFMADGYIGINFTRRTAPNQPLINATLPTDFAPLRRIDNLVYKYNGSNKYYAVNGLYMQGYSGLTSGAPIDISTYYGK